jgi:hypothetical protein
MLLPHPPTHPDLMAELADDLRAHPAPDGTVWLCHLDASGLPCLRSRIPEPAEATDELYLRDLEARVASICLPAVVLAIRRADGRPRPIDRRLARELAARLSAAGLAMSDAVVVGDQNHRSLTSPATAAARTGVTGRAH